MNTVPAEESVIETVLLDTIVVSVSWGSASRWHCGKADPSPVDRMTDKVNKRTIRILLECIVV